jgi:hypothetical protein
MEAIVALLLTVAFASLLGFMRGGGRRDDLDTETLGTTYSKYLRAVSAAGLVRLSKYLGDAPAEEDIADSVDGPQLIADMVALLEDEKADTVITGLRFDQDPTVGTFLTRIADDADKYWPGQISQLQRVRESLP